MIKFGLESLKEWRLGNLLYWSTYCIFAIAEKKHVAIAAENINVNVIMSSHFSVILADDISQCRLTVSGKAGLLSIGSPVSHDPTACTQVNHGGNCCVKSVLHPLVNLQCDRQLTPEIDWKSSDHIFTSNNPPRNLRFLCTSGLPFLLSLIRMPGCVGVAPT